MTFSWVYSWVINLIKGIKEYYAKNSCVGKENAGIEMTYFMFEK